MGQSNAIKLAIGIIALLSIILYWYSLTSKIEHQEAKILELSTAIKVQNAAVLENKNKKEELDKKLKSISEVNDKLANENIKLKNSIFNRKPSTTCDDAFTYLSDTAKHVAEEFNK